MRRRALAAVAILLAPAALASTESYVTLVDWERGEFLVGAPAGVSGVNAWRPAFHAGACHRDLRLDVLYDPANVTVAVPEVGSVTFLYEMRAEVWGSGALLSSTRITEPGYGRPIGRVPAEGDYELHLFLRLGADVAWEARLRARATPGEAACGGTVGETPLAKD